MKKNVFHFMNLAWVCISLIPVSLLFYAPFNDFGPGYYTLLKWVVFVFSIERFIKLSSSSNISYRIVFALLIMLFQPFWGWGFRPQLWNRIDFISGFACLTYTLFYYLETRRGIVIFDLDITKMRRYSGYR